MSAPPSYREQLSLAARAALDQLTGPERVEVILHYRGSATKAYPSRVEYYRCGCCDCCDCCQCGVP